ncbi:TerB family tellurite resistance protein [Cognatiyoonia sp. IB215182]|uniref:tellurite resistance TerB family protein n=1 Tax=Cognatiyoonia sp. IB215182 TaxID=3097353 RepID=UPI002A108597|nr:TerB family tellurite resistance protein [Cognatiyoonia sp. IB215182]MDX8351222.1 TerB family tellurite resistance protein [Cognatiyoonia sp. IB215182]
MFSDLLRRLTAPEPAPLAQTDARLALAALLVRIARTDGDYAAVEIAQIDQSLARRYGLDAGAAAALRQEAEALEAEAPDTVRFTRAIKDAVAYEERVGVVEAMWAVVMADGVRDDEEDSMMRMAASLLGVSDQDSHAARLRVSAG